MSTTSQDGARISNLEDRAWLMHNLGKNCKFSNVQYI
jgi:hypothetical protein